MDYPSGADMSGYKYLVIKLAATSSDSHLNIFTEGSIWSACCATPDFGSKKQIVLNLSTAKYTSDSDKKGQPLDTKNIRIVSFWGNGNKSIRVNEMYLTNNDDYSPETPTSIVDPRSSFLVSPSSSLVPRSYDVMGRPATSDHRGLVIVRTADGQVRKIFNKQ